VRRRIEAGDEACQNLPKERYAMTTNSSILAFPHPDEIDDPLTLVLREGARRLLAQAVEAEAEAFLAAMSGERLADGRARLVRHGHGPERTIQTGIGPVPVRRAKLRDRGGDEASETGGDRITFTSAILPKWARRTKSLDALLPVLYLRGISTGDFQEALAALLGKDAPNLSPSVIGRLKEAWQADYDRWQRRDLSARRYVYIWADGVYLQARMEEDAACMLVVIGATPEGRKELVGFQVGVRESTQSWRELLVDLKARGLSSAPEIAVGDGALGFWKALEEIFPSTRHQRCWQHKLVNILNKVPKSVQPNMKADLREVRDAPDRATAEAAITTFVEKYAAKYPKAVECLTKDRDALLAFFDFPAEHWDHLRTSNPIESVFATVRHRTVRSKGALSHETARLMVFKLVMSAAKTWRRLKGEHQVPMVIAGVTFTDGVAVTVKPDHRAA
jgi:putative transposase